MLILGIFLLTAAVVSWRTDPGHSQTLLVVSRLAAIVLGVVGAGLVALGAA